MMPQHWIRMFAYLNIFKFPFGTPQGLVSKEFVTKMKQPKTWKMLNFPSIRLPLAHLKVHLIMGLCCSKRLVGCDSSEHCCVKYKLDFKFVKKYPPENWHNHITPTFLALLIRWLFLFPRWNMCSFHFFNFRNPTSLDVDRSCTSQGKATRICEGFYVTICIHLSPFAVHPMSISLVPSCWSRNVPPVTR